MPSIKRIMVKASGLPELSQPNKGTTLTTLNSSCRCKPHICAKSLPDLDPNPCLTMTTTPTTATYTTSSGHLVSNWASTSKSRTASGSHLKKNSKLLAINTD